MIADEPVSAPDVGAPVREPDDGFATGYGAVLCLYPRTTHGREHIADEVMVSVLRPLRGEGTKDQIQQPASSATRALLATPRLNPTIAVSG